MDPRRRERGSLEREVIAALAGSVTPLSPGQVRERMGVDLAYTTVMTVLTRLAAKGLVVRTRAGRGYVYGAVLDAAEITAQRMRRLLDTGDDRAAVLTRFVGTLSDEDERLLTDLLRPENPRESGSGDHAVDDPAPDDPVGQHVGDQDGGGRDRGDDGPTEGIPSR
jgi:predicted transcriptional regulator